MAESLATKYSRTGNNSYFEFEFNNSSYTNYGIEKEEILPKI
jgi:hypothetical protein